MRRETLLVVVVLVVVALPVVASAQGSDSGVKDFRAYVFGAYTAAFVVLFGLLAVLFARQGRIADELEELRERVERSGRPSGS